MQARGISLVLAGVFNGGFLAHPRPGVPFNCGPESPPMLQKALRIKICDRHGVLDEATAIQFSFALLNRTGSGGDPDDWFQAAVAT